MGVLCGASFPHAMRRPERPRLGIQRCGRQACRERGVLDNGMSQSIFHKRQQGLHSKNTWLEKGNTKLSCLRAKEHACPRFLWQT